MGCHASRDEMTFNNWQRPLGVAATHKSPSALDSVHRHTRCHIGRKPCALGQWAELIHEQLR